MSNFFQILLTGENKNRPTLPDVFAENVDKFKSLYPDFRYHLLRDQEIERIISHSFHADVYKTYRLLRPLAFRADLARYCLLYLYGGWYADISLKPLFRCQLPPKTKFFYFQDHGDGSMRAGPSVFDCQNGFFYSERGSSILLGAIKAIVKNCENRFYGLTSLSPTGPTLFGSLIANQKPSLNRLAGVFMPLTPDLKNKNRAYVSPDGTLLAMHKSSWHALHPGGGDFLSMFDLNGKANNYNWLWRNRKIYIE